MLTQNLLLFIDSKLVMIMLFALLDVIIGMKISNIFITNSDQDRKISKSNDSQYYIEMIYLFNPVSILNCSLMRLDIFYTFLNLMFFSNKDNFLGTFFLILSMITSPGFIFINLFFMIFIVYNQINKNYWKMFLNSTICLLAIGFTLFIFDCDTKFNNSAYFDILNDFIKKFAADIKLIYYNYYFLKDTLPNIGLFWALIPETFLKFYNFTCLILLHYQAFVNFAILCLMFKMSKIYKNKFSLAYSILFLFNHIIDRYPCENHYVVSMLLILQHHEIIYKSLFNLAVYCSVAGYSLIFSRGFPYKSKRTGTSNYLYFQNLTYSCFLIFVLLYVIFSIFEFVKKTNRLTKIKLIVNEIIDKIIK